MLRLVSSIIPRQSLIPRLPSSSCSAATSLSSRTLFSDSFHKMHTFLDSVSKLKLMIQDPPAYKSKVLENFRATGLQNIFDEEISNTVALSENEEDLRSCKELLVAIYGNSLRMGDKESKDKMYLALVNFFKLCKLFNSVDVAVEMWKNETVQQSMLLQNSKTISRLYIDLMFENGRYQDIVDEYLKSPDHLAKFEFMYALVPLSCYKIGTREALETALNVLHLMKKDKIQTSRGPKAAALLAYNLNENVIAHNLLRKQGKHIFNEHLEILLLLQADKLQEAVTYFKANKVPHPHYKRHITILYDVVVEMIRKVRESGDEALLNDVMNMVTIIDKSDITVVKNTKLEDILLEPLVSPTDNTIRGRRNHT